MDNYWVSPKKVGLVSEASLKTFSSPIVVEARLPLTLITLLRIYPVFSILPDGLKNSFQRGGINVLDDLPTLRPLLSNLRYVHLFNVIEDVF